MSWGISEIVVTPGRAPAKFINAKDNYESRTPLSQIKSLRVIFELIFIYRFCSLELTISIGTKQKNQLTTNVNKETKIESKVTQF